MQATLILNPNAGGANAADPDVFQQALADAGYDPVHRQTTTEADLDEVLAEARGLVVAVGGDGTVRAVARRLVGREVPLAIVPLGTANNIGRSLGLIAPPLEIIAGLVRPRRQHFDVGLLRGPWGEDCFLEAAGCGLYADTLSAYDPEEGKSVGRALSALRATVGSYAPPEVRVRIDGEDITGAFLLLEAMNTTATGPRLGLAPDADVSDGLLEVVMVRAEEREGLLAYVGGLLTGQVHRLESVEVRRAREIEVTWCGQAVHVDGEVRPPRGPDSDPPIVYEDGAVNIGVLPGALELFLPTLGEEEP